MKIIDLLNKIAKGELEDLTLVHFCKNNCLTKYHKTDNRFEFMYKGDWNNYFHLIDIEELNEEVAIIENLEEVEDKEYEDIEELTINGKEISYGAMNEWLCMATNNEKKICSGIEGMAMTVNALIRNQKYILERLDK